MGIYFSKVCCSCYADRLATEEGSLVSIKSEIKEQHEIEKQSQPFQNYLSRKRSESEDSLSLHFLDSRRLDYFNKDNKSMNMSAILSVQEIPQIPDPSNTLCEFQQRDTRSISLNKGPKKLSKFDLSISRQRKSLYRCK